MIPFWGCVLVPPHGFMGRCFKLCTTLPSNVDVSSDFRSLRLRGEGEAPPILSTPALFFFSHCAYIDQGRCCRSLTSRTL